MPASTMTMIIYRFRYACPVTFSCSAAECSIDIDIARDT
jgi:hypothetical protein